MKINNKIILFLFFSISLFHSCDNDFEEINNNPNDPIVVPTSGLFNGAMKELMDQTRDEWAAGRFSQAWMQYTCSVNYTEEDRYQFRETQTDQLWDLYFVAKDFKSIIDLNTDPATMNDMAAYGSNENQIAAARVMLAYLFSYLTQTYGDIPYYSYGDSENMNFQALDIENLQPVYAAQSEIFPDILNELKEAAASFDISQPVFTNGDTLYDGDASQWIKFANSLRLRIANHIKSVYPEANTHISEAIAGGVFTSNADNASQKYEDNITFGNPWFRAFENRTDFAVTSTFVDLLKGEIGSYGQDPRLQKMVAPASATKYDVFDYSYTESDNLDDYQGMPFGVENSTAGLEFSPTTISFTSSMVMSADSEEVLMEYAEVEFILSEINDWDQTHYENGVRASMERWGVETDDINSYMSTLPMVNMENVFNQKYIALYMQPHEAWTEYRRTGYPDFILKPGDTGLLTDGVSTYTFNALVPEATDLPYRITYPVSSITLNGENFYTAVENLSQGNTIVSKLWWDVN